MAIVDLDFQKWLGKFRAYNPDLFTGKHGLAERMATDIAQIAFSAGKNAARATPAPQPVEAEGREAVAFVPVHPRNGPLWLETYPAGDVADGRSPHYPRMPLYTTPPPEQPAIERLTELMAKARALVETMESGDDSRSQFIALKLAIIDSAMAGRVKGDS